MSFRTRTRSALVVASGAATLAGCHLGVPRDTVDVPAAAVAVGDLDGDGLADLVTVGNDAGTDTIAVHLSEGTGGVVTTSDVRDDVLDYLFYTDVALLDADRDGDQDLLVCDYVERAGSGTLYLWRNDGSGTMTRGSGVESCVDHIVTGDVDGDGMEDFVVVDWGGASVGISAGDGTFSTSLVASADTVDVADVNDDGLDDVLVSRRDGSPGVSVLLSEGGGAFGAPTHHPLGEGATTALGLRAGDIDNDGTTDVVVAGADDDGDELVLSALLGHGDGGFSPGGLYSLGPRPIRGSLAVSDLELADIDDDGALDAIVNGMTVVFGDGTGGFVSEHSVAGGSDAAVLDLDGDAVPDMASGERDHLYLFLNRLDGARAHE